MMHASSALFFLPLGEVHVWFSSMRSVSSRSVLLDLLSRYLGVPIDTLVLKKTDRGKLFLPEHPSLFFSIAHSGGVLVLAFSHDPVGIDLEKKRKMKALAVASKFFSRDELDFISSEGEVQIDGKFLQLWTAKEATLKADGRGITAGLREAFAYLKNNQVIAVKLGLDSWFINSWFLQEPSSRDPITYAVAVASLASPSLIRWYDAGLPASVNS